MEIHRQIPGTAQYREVGCIQRLDPGFYICSPAGLLGYLGKQSRAVGFKNGIQDRANLVPMEEIWGDAWTEPMFHGDILE